MAFLSPSSAARLAALALLSASSAATAARYVATGTTLKSVFAKAAAGDMIVLSGHFGGTVFEDRNFSKPLQIDARRAQFDGTLVIRNMQGLVISGGRFGTDKTSWQNAGTIRVESSDTISFLRPRLAAAGLGKARGIGFSDTSNFSVEGGTFSGFRVAMGGHAMTNGLFANNKITRSTSDGIDIVDSHFITARGNSCTGGIPSATAHPDCIQMWSISGNPVQSDIQLLNNIATGSTQGFTSFDPDRGGGLRISMIGNRVDTTFPQGIACYNCVDSIITDNVLTTLPGARFRTYLRVIGGSNNIVANNSIGPFPPAIGPGTSAFGLRPDGLSALAAPADIIESSGLALAAVPEPAVWAQLIGGFALLGTLARRRRRAASTECLV